MEALKLTKKAIHKGNLILVNSKYPHLPASNVELLCPDTKTPDILIERNAATVLSHILRDINCTDEIVPVSGHRTKTEQENIFLNSLKENGPDFTMKYVALPNHSEHQTGLAIDVGLKKKLLTLFVQTFPTKEFVINFVR